MSFEIRRPCWVWCEKLLHVAAQQMDWYKLAESDIPGALLKGRQQNDLTVPEL